MTRLHSGRRGREIIRWKTRYFDPKVCSQCIAMAAPYPSSLGGVYQPVCVGGGEGGTAPHSDQRINAPTNKCDARMQSELTVLFMNLHEGFVRLLCSSEIVLVLEDKGNGSAQLQHSHVMETKDQY